MPKGGVAAPGSCPLVRSTNVLPNVPQTDRACRVLSFLAAASALLDVPLGHKDDSRSFPHFDTITVSVADGPRPNEILVVMAIADGGRLRNRCGTEPIR
jgi:hypothetical protein